MIKIRAAAPGDAGSVASIYTELTGSTANWSDVIENGSVVVAEVDGRLVGFGGNDLKTINQLKWLYVLPETQGVGIGSALLEKLETMAKSVGLDSLRLHAAPDATEFYRRHGYSEVPIDERQRHDHEGVEMMKDFESKELL
jgi:ribosomal protein S18 acetylase RimI-like enzyme